MSATVRDLLADQISFYWEFHLWPRLDGAPQAPPVTTIAWRMAHLGRDVWARRARALFGPTPAPADADMFDARHWDDPLPLTAAGGLELLRAGNEAWQEGLAGLDDGDLARPLGPRGGPFAEDSLAALAAHLNREGMAHGAETCLLRDLHRARSAVA